MKKLAGLLTMVAMASLLFAGSAMAYENDSTGSLDFHAGTATALSIGLSPKVHAIYYTDGTDAGTAQWYAIGAAHPGGNTIYATAQNLTNTYSKSFTTGTTINAALFALPASKNSASAWSDAGWKQ